MVIRLFYFSLWVYLNAVPHSCLALFHLMNCISHLFTSIIWTLLNMNRKQYLETCKHLLLGGEQGMCDWEAGCRQEEMGPSWFTKGGTAGTSIAASLWHLQVLMSCQSLLDHEWGQSLVHGSGADVKTPLCHLRKTENGQGNMKGEIRIAKHTPHSLLMKNSGCYGPVAERVHRSIKSALSALQPLSAGVRWPFSLLRLLPSPYPSISFSFLFFSHHDSLLPWPSPFTPLNLPLRSEMVLCLSQNSNF